MNKIVIYTEGGFYLGLGNIYRMTELGKLLKSKGKDAQITFVTSSEDYVVNLIKNRGFEVKQTAVNEIISLISNLDFNILIIDKLGIEETFIKAIKALKTKTFKVVLFGNISTANQIADLVINAIIGSDFSNKAYIDKYGTKYLTGPKCLTIREEFKHHAYVYRNQCEKILLLFGGTDQTNYSCKVLNDLLKSNIQYNITLVIGKGYKFLEELKGLLSELNNVTVLKDINNVNKVMLANDFLITSPGTALFEALYLGLPCLALYQNESQKEIFRDFLFTKSYEEITNLSDYILEIYKDYKNYLKKIDELEVGKGKNEIINNIIELI